MKRPTFLILVLLFGFALHSAPVLAIVAAPESVRDDFDTAQRTQTSITAQNPLEKKFGQDEQRLETILQDLKKDERALHAASESFHLETKEGADGHSLH